LGRARAHAEQLVDASPAAVYQVLADYGTHHPRIMPASLFSDLEVASGGVGAGTVFHITLRTMGRRQRLHMQVAEPEPGQVLTETNLDTGVVTEFGVAPGDGACRSHRLLGLGHHRRLACSNDHAAKGLLRIGSDDRGSA